MEAELQENELTSVEFQRLLSRKFSISIIAPLYVYMKIYISSYIHMNKQLPTSGASVYYTDAPEVGA